EIGILAVSEALEKFTFTIPPKMLQQVRAGHLIPQRRRHVRVVENLSALFSLLLQGSTTTPGFARGGREFYFPTKRTFDFVQNWHQRECSTSASRIRSEVWPSQSGGRARAFFADPFSVAF